MEAKQGPRSSTAQGASSWCPACHTENVAPARYCIGCGTALFMRCLECQSENSLEAVTCEVCGRDLRPSQRTGPADGTVRSAGDAPSTLAATRAELERRPVTVLFCDMVGSTELSFRLDPEELSEVLVAYRETCSAAVEHFGGFVARFVGDSLMVYFGYPKAHGDDAARALHAALAILHDIRELGERLNHRLGCELGVHIGVHTGPVIAGELGSGSLRESAAVVGMTPNIAARLQSAARAGEIVISGDTYDQIAGLFDCERMPALGIQGNRAADNVVPRAERAHDRIGRSLRRGPHSDYAWSRPRIRTPCGAMVPGRAG